MAALSDRSGKAIKLRASRLKLNRKTGPNRWQPWTYEDDERLKTLCQQGIQYADIAGELGRSAASITQRLREKGWNRLNMGVKRKTRARWEVSDLLSSHELSSRGG
jgi:3-deoxy-D-manno-octulosonate 8-phosphate phosphatase KdsC-like HAD superfamily phosphatase